jgi:16S rRNA (uracil1498-N3)-methyltransferase
MADRYFVETPITADRALLTGPEAHHLIHVMRAKPGDQTILFDGSGREFTASIQQVRRAEVELKILSQQPVDRELPLRLTLGVALPKAPRQKWLVEKAVELGVSRLEPLETARGVAQPAQHALERLRRTVVEASKQCGRNRLMEIAAPRPWGDFVRSAGDASWRLLAHRMSGQGGQSHFCRAPCDAWSLPQKSGQSPAVLAVGPEGGFAEEEVALALAAGWTPVDLGPRILRVETAAVALVAGVIMSWPRTVPWRGSWQSP